MTEKLTPSDKIKILEVFENPYPERNYRILHKVTEFTSLCPKTGHPDFGTIYIEYIAAKTCVELKSLKLYFQSYRNDGIFYESVTNKILTDLVYVLNPVYLKVKAEFSLRGGICSTIQAIHETPAYIKFVDNTTDDVDLIDQL